MERIAWEDLPDQLIDAIEDRTGPVTAARVAADGLNSPLAAVIDTTGGKFFAKGLPADHRLAVTQDREAAAVPLVTGIAPALRWHFTDAGWNVLIFEHVSGRAADYTPGSPDLDHIVTVMQALSAIKPPPAPGLLKTAADRWKSYVDDPCDLAAFAGPVLAHTDWTPDNVLVTPGRTWLVDWAWPTLAAPWTDPACWITRLMAAGGHTAAEAEAQARRLPAYTAADPACIDLFARANARLWNEIEENGGGASWTKKMAHAARTWAAHRHTR